MTHRGRSIVRGTQLSIVGERGRFRFLRLVERPSGIAWIDCLTEQGFRSFRPERIKTVHVKRKALR